MSAPKLAAVIGNPIGHSLSPVIHRCWANREGIKANYIPIEAGDGYGAFARVAEALAALGAAGCNVTLPHKENALAFAARSSPRALRAGAANMLTFGEGGPYADNSDIEGFHKALVAELGKSAPRRRALILGAGGAARGVVLALKEMGYAEILVANRTPERAAALAGDLGAVTLSWRERNEALADMDVLVNATSLGMTGAPPLEISLDLLPDHAAVADIVYHPLETGLLRAAKARRLAAVDGLAMLMHQAVPGYLAWFGKQAEVDGLLRGQLVAALKARVM